MRAFDRPPTDTRFSWECFVSPDTRSTVYSAGLGGGHERPSMQTDWGKTDHCKILECTSVGAKRA
eukprot:105520-Alexandrium_andersonii.AAC.1